MTTRGLPFRVVAKVRVRVKPLGTVLGRNGTAQSEQEGTPMNSLPSQKRA
jgi:hypothetical protein